ncbi:hypothetical protein CCACVL1_06215 [Corchorus capsularis]|uniref:Uncharacterized protein n=1 Tax=Corchorus capsularis TaxID=210143 RepID=A0A1R3JGT2_COCAP|nr:hypothetical protein CCACVL1_06215 [Corchorus capsularis]
MAFMRAFQIVLIILMVASLPLLLSSRTSNRLLGETTMAVDTSAMRKGLGSNYWFKSLGRRGSAFIGEKRQVPTGPDPLHHNSNPTGP